MQLIIAARGLRALLSDAKAIAKRRHALPILHHVVLRAEGNRLTLSCTDLDLSLTGSEPAQVGTPGTVTVPFVTLSTLVDRLHDDVRLEAKGLDTVLRCGTSRYLLRGLAPQDYPAPVQPPEDAGFDVAPELLTQALTATLYATTQDPTSWMGCVRLAAKGGTFSAMAADGSRMAGYRTAMADTPEVMAVAARRLLEEVVGLLRGVTDPVSIALGAQTMRLKTPTRTLVARLSDQAFGQIEAVVPVSHQHRALVTRDALVEALTRSVAILPPTEHVVRLEVTEGQLAIASHAPGSTEGSELLAAQTQGEPIAWWMNGAYLLDALKPIPGPHVALELNGPLLPIRLEDPDHPAFIAVVMPMNKQ